MSQEYNFDGLVGPTHNYAGLSLGNMASTKNKNTASNPQKAALQGLEKMKFLMDLGLKQAVIPPQERPHIYTLKKLGFSGSDTEILEKAFHRDPQLLFNCSSASSMWTANAATISPKADCQDGRLHISIANLANKFHRSIEHKLTYKVLSIIFKDDEHFAIHEALPSSNQFGDEGAANHTRLCLDFSKQGLEFFVFGKYAFQSGKPKPKYFPGRQTFEASSAICRRHNLKPNSFFFAQQNPIAIDSGVFHNDVIAVGNQNVLLYHEQAFFDAKETIQKLEQQFQELTGYPLCSVKVSGHELTIKEAVHSYLFNSQLVTLNDQSMALIAPAECENNRIVNKCIDRIIGNNDNPITQAHYLNLRQSMNNGGGPACLRLRVVLDDIQTSKLGGSCILDEALYLKLYEWVKTHYRDKLEPQDLADPQLLIETRQALDQLSQILNLGSVYQFQL